MAPPFFLFLERGAICTTDLAQSRLGQSQGGSLLPQQLCFGLSDLGTDLSLEQGVAWTGLAWQYKALEVSFEEPVCQEACSFGSRPVLCDIRQHASSLCI